MNWQKNRLWIVAAALLVLVAASVWASLQRERSSTPQTADFSSKLPRAEKNKIDALEIYRPKSEGVRLVKVEGRWRMVAPVEAEADQEAVGTALDKLAQLEVGGVAATSSANHAKLEVTADRAVHVVAKQAGKILLDFWVGAYRGGSTMVRTQNDVEVYEVKGSMRYAFDKEAKDWRDRQVLKVDAAALQSIRFEHEKAQFSFTRREGNWVTVNAKPPIKELDGDQVDAIARSLTDLRAADFAPASMNEAAAGIGDKSPRIVLTLDPSKAEQSKPSDAGVTDAGAAVAAYSETFLLGNKTQAGETYLQRQGVSTLYLIAPYVADRLQPKVEDLQKKKEDPSKPEAEAGGMPTPAGGEAMPGGGNIPPEMLEKLRQQMGQ